MQDFSQLGPEVTGFAPATPAPGFVRLKVHDVRTHWEPWLWAGQLCEHVRAADGSVVVDVPAAHVGAVLKAGYAIFVG
jgi:hypothetical protein